jgi:hypothetical protein
MIVLEQEVSIMVRGLEVGRDELSEGENMKGRIVRVGMREK